jgi:flagellar hook-length control protein FliK
LRNLAADNAIVAEVAQEQLDEHATPAQDIERTGAAAKSQEASASTRHAGDVRLHTAASSDVAPLDELTQGLREKTATSAAAEESLATEESPNSLAVSREVRRARSKRGEGQLDVVEHRPTETRVGRSIAPSDEALAAKTGDLSPGTSEKPPSDGSPIDPSESSRYVAAGAVDSVPATSPVGPETGQEVTPASSRLAQHLLARPGERESRSGAVRDVDRARLLDRVARAFQAVEGRQGVVRLRLHPPELGSLRVEIRVQHGALTARLETESAAVQSLLIDHAQALRERLAEQGIRVERFDVDFRDGRSPDPRGGDERQSSADGGWPRAPRRSADVLPPSSPPVHPLPHLPLPGKLNVII